MLTIWFLSLISQRRDQQFRVGYLLYTAFDWEFFRVADAIIRDTDELHASVILLMS